MKAPVLAFPAGSDLGDVRGKAVSLDENGTLILTATGKIPLGIAVLGNPETVVKDDTVTVQIKDIGCVKAGAAVQSGDALTVDSSGAFIPATSGNYYAVALESGAKDAFIRAILRSGSLAAASGDLTGGEDPSVTNADYSKAFEALEPFYYNCIALDVNDDESLSKTLLLQAYLDHAYESGKLAIAVAGETGDVDFSTRLQHARALNDEKMVYLGAGWRTITDDKDGVFAICHLAGVIASTPANQSIAHTVIRGATDILETFTYAQYADAIQAGALMPSMSNDGSIWFDSGVNTLVYLFSTQNEGWKKIRRTKTRFELFDRLDRALHPKVGRINCDTDDIGDVIQTAARVLDAMITERKLSPGAAFQVERYAGDSAWFTITADDIDSLEKIYLHYQFRFSQE